MKYNFQGGRWNGQQKDMPSPAPRVVRVCRHRNDIATNESLVDYQEYDLDEDNGVYEYRCTKRKSCDLCDEPASCHVVEMINLEWVVRNLCNAHSTN